MPTIDPKISFYLNIAMAIATAIAGGTISFGDLLPSETSHAVVGWCALFSSIYAVVNVYLSGYSSKASGPLVKDTITNPSSGK